MRTEAEIRGAIKEMKQKELHAIGIGKIFWRNRYFALLWVLEESDSYSECHKVIQ